MSLNEVSKEEKKELIKRWIEEVDEATLDAVLYDLLKYHKPFYFDFE